ncbi:MAG: glycine--tRNA ligase subunit beta, partial [Deltaproteobacteria bacterium]|nr:glycine--tRNA ligase subunit beta [Deltaproteobacteria bacterium]
LVELPLLVLARFDDVFLELPREVLVTAMRSHQRYFAMEDPDGNLVSTFGVVANNRASDMEVVVRGNQRVIAARLYDARFFWDQDLKTGLDALASRLGERLFLKGAGDMAEKATRIAALTGAICGVSGLDDDVRKTASRAAALCKADLMSQMVGEFPDLQGVMGGYYALAQGETEGVATAIREHYLPRHAGDALPSSEAGAVLAIADRMDSIVRCFEVGAVPTGSRDPLALRRAALGILRILENSPGLNKISFSRLMELVSEDVRVGVTDFFVDRFRTILNEDHEIPTDFANAVAEKLREDESPPPERLAAFANVLKNEDPIRLRAFLDAVYKRPNNICRKAAEEGLWDREVMDRTDLTDDWIRGLPTDGDQRLATAVRAADERLFEESVWKDPKFIIDTFFTLEAPIAGFLGSGKDDGVPVLICKDHGLRTQRLQLLGLVWKLLDRFADFSRISTR